jgi:hypothetical protein
MQIAGVALHAEGFSSSLAAAIAVAAPERVARIELRGACLPSPSLRQLMVEHYAPEIDLMPDGSHWYRTWLMLRDSLVRFPWFDGRIAALRRVASDFDAQRLHDWTFEVLKQPRCYRHAILAALRYDLESALPSLAGRVVALDDSQHPFATFGPKFRQLIRG